MVMVALGRAAEEKRERRKMNKTADCMWGKGGVESNGGGDISSDQESARLLRSLRDERSVSGRYKYSNMSLRTLRLSSADLMSCAFFMSSKICSKRRT